jgi:hypothetical protein
VKGQKTNLYINLKRQALVANYLVVIYVDDRRNKAHQSASIHRESVEPTTNGSMTPTKPEQIDTHMASREGITRYTKNTN